jgi:hypothetical protein
VGRKNFAHGWAGVSDQGLIAAKNQAGGLWISGAKLRRGTQSALCSLISKLFSPLIFFIRIYSLYREDSLWQFQIGLYCTLVRSPQSLPLDPSPPLLELLQEVSLFYFMSI